MAGAGWCLGKVRCRSAGDVAASWRSAYLNAAERADPFADEPCTKPAAPSATETAPAEPEPAATVQPRPFEEPASMIVVCEDDPPPAGRGAVAHAAR